MGNRKKSTTSTTDSIRTEKGDSAQHGPESSKDYNYKRKKN